MGGLNAEMTATARELGKSVAFRVVTKAMGAGSVVATHLTFREAEGMTHVHWTGEIVEVTGLLKAVPNGLLQGTAQKVIEDVWTAVTARLAPR
jgi:carbon monoxide dehydrogenase subunit G